jgi:ATP-binding cassette subfamily F protein 3
MIQLSNLTLQRGNKILIENATVTIYANQKFGLIGANGSGKSSLFSLILGDIQAEQGTIEKAKQLKLAHLSQEIHNTDQAAIEFVIDGDAELRQLEFKLEQANLAEEFEKIAPIHAKLETIDAYTAYSRAAKLLVGLGFPNDVHLKTVNAFSGGWQMRLNLARTLMARSDVLLLDEPTNHLDLDAILWLETWLKNYPGTLLLISHDRDFLDATVNGIVHLEQQNLKLYSGNYSDFEKQRAASLVLQQAQHEKQQQKINHAMAFVNRFRAKATKAKQAQSRLKALEKLEIIQAAQPEHFFQFEFKTASKCPNPILQLENVAVGYENKTILENINLSLLPGSRIGLLGVNGAGKSTLIKLLAEEIVAKTGEYNKHPATIIGYYSQNLVDQLDLDATPLQQIQSLDNRTSTQDLRNFLGSFNFAGDMATTPIRIFSGGEKARLALALIVWQKPNLLLLDEPTNHLDLNMRNALAVALQTYEGALIVVSHDRYLLRSTVDEFLLVANQRLSKFDGDLEDYQKWLLAPRELKTSMPSNITSEPVKKNNYQLKKQLESDLRKTETQIKKLQNQLTEINELLTQTELYTQEKTEILEQCLQQQKELQNQISALEAEWIHLSETLESL